MDNAKPSTKPPTVKRQELEIRPLAGADLDVVVAIDRAVVKRSRRAFYERRLAVYARDPGGFLALGATFRGRLVGFAFARLYEGEFGALERRAALDAVGVDPQSRRRGVGRELIEGLAAALRIHGVTELSTQADWTATDLLGFFARTRFALAPRLVLARAVGEIAASAKRETPSPATRGPVELDFSKSSRDEVGSLARDRMPVRSLERADLAGILHIDSHITGRSREAYFRRKLAEALDESAVRVSLVAPQDKAAAGFIMAQVDFGEFGSLEPEAVIDTIGVEPSYGHKGVGAALVSQLMANLSGLRVERVRTEVDWQHFGLSSFFAKMGFEPDRRLALRRRLG